MATPSANNIVERVLAHFKNNGIKVSKLKGIGLDFDTGRKAGAISTLKTKLK